MEGNENMKKIIKAGICVAAVAMIMTGCGNKNQNAESSSAAVEETASATTETETKSEEELHDEESVTLGDYKKLTFSAKEEEVTDAQIETRLKELCAEYPVTIEGRPAQEGDTANIDYSGTKDGEAFAGGTAEGYDLKLGSGTFIDGFEDGLIGAAAGEQRNLNLTFPENYQSEELAGQDVVFEVTVNEVAEKHTPELTEAFVAENFPDLGTVDAYKEDLRQQMLDSKQQQSDQQRNAELLSAIVEDSEITCAPEDVDEIYDQQINYYTTMASLYGLELADYASVMGMDKDTFRTEVRNIAELTVKQNMVLDEVAKKEGLKVEDADRQALAEEYKDVYESVDDMIEQAGAENVDRAILSEKALQVIVDNADITTVDGIDVAE